MKSSIATFGPPLMASLTPTSPSDDRDRQRPARRRVPPTSQGPRPRGSSNSSRSEPQRKSPPWYLSALLTLLVAATPVLLTRLLIPSASSNVPGGSSGGLPTPSASVRPGAASDRGLRSTTSAVNSKSGWQNTHVSVQTGHSLDISYSTGAWTVDSTQFPYVGPSGYDPTTDQQIYQGCKFDLNKPYANMLAKLVAPDGQESPFTAGAGVRLVAPISGTLFLRINDKDECLGDNDGVVRMSISWN